MSEYILKLQQSLEVERKRTRKFESFTFVLLGISHLILAFFAIMLIYKIWIS